jgi:tetratricopeptide (TPR) repeat protein
MLRSLIAACALLYVLPSTAADFDALAKRSWIKAETRNFILITDQPEAIARQVVNDLETMRHFRTVFGGMQPLAVSRPLPILAIGDDDTFTQLGLEKMVAGSFSIGLEGYSALANIHHYNAEGTENSFARAVMLHEYNHFLVRMTEQIRAYPQWLDEGLAEYWATFNVEGQVVRLGNHVDGGGRFYGILGHSGMSVSIDTGKTFNTVELPINSESRSDEFEVQKFYSSAYFAVHYFNSTPALRTRLADYIAMINLGYRQDRAAELAFKMPYEQLNKEIVKYVKRSMVLRELTLKNGKFDFPQVQPVVTHLDKPALYAGLAQIISRHHFPRKDTLALLAKNRELNPDDADANVLPAVFGMLRGEQEYAQLMRRFPKHPALLTMRANGLQRQAETMKDRGAEGWLEVARQARGLYREAIAIDRDYPQAFLGLGRLYRLLPDGEPLEEAVAGLDTASIYSRQPEIFSELAATYLRMKRPMDALQSLRNAVAFSAKPVHGTDVLLLENLELLADLQGEARPHPSGLVYDSETVYAGPVSAGKPAGKGRMTLLDGSWYEGDFVQGLPHGKGRLVSDQGMVYEGEFERGVARGQGRILYPAGDDTMSYTGQVDYMAPSGAGELLTSAGRYVGQFAHGVPHGAGAFTAAHRPVTLQGQWIRGGFEWPLSDGLVFTGPANADGLADGKGSCRGANPHEVPRPCRFKDGKRAGGGN